MIPSEPPAEILPGESLEGPFTIFAAIDGVIPADLESPMPPRIARGPYVSLVGEYGIVR
jgi:hypothetical protein